MDIFVQLECGLKIDSHMWFPSKSQAFEPHFSQIFDDQNLGYPLILGQHYLDPLLASTAWPLAAGDFFLGFGLLVQMFQPVNKGHRIANRSI